VLIDTHCHLWFDDFDADRDACLQRAATAGVTGFVQVGTDLVSNDRAIALARAHPTAMRATVGVHPHDAKSIDDGALARLRAQAADPMVVAIGEIGLDYFRDHSPRDVQRDAFQRQLALARELDQPIVLHCRDAHDDLLAILRAGAPWRGIAHCYSGGPERLDAYLALGLHVSLAGPVTYKNAVGLRAAARTVPADRLLLETDCPYLTPVPHRGRRNEPAFLRFTAQAVAAARGEPLDALAARTTANAEALLGPIRARA
jgi:TatD DNase family protein